MSLSVGQRCWYQYLWCPSIVSPVPALLLGQRSACNKSLTRVQVEWRPSGGLCPFLVSHQPDDLWSPLPRTPPLPRLAYAHSVCATFCVLNSPAVSKARPWSASSSPYLMTRGGVAPQALMQASGHDRFTAAAAPTISRLLLPNHALVVSSSPSPPLAAAPPPHRCSKVWNISPSSA